MYAGEAGRAVCLLREENQELAFIDVNTALSLPYLLAGLDELGFSVNQVRAVIVTHAHLDHAGGAWAVLEKCPNARLYAHPRAARHLIDPTKLRAGALQVYGAERYRMAIGDLKPIPAERVTVLEDGDFVPLGSMKFQTWHTPGHAKHHLVVHDSIRDAVYAGDTFGIVYPPLQREGPFGFASTSPVDFDGVEAHKSLKKILSLHPARICVTHYGEYTNLAPLAGQLAGWIDFCMELLHRRREFPRARLQEQFREDFRAEFTLRSHAVGLTLSAADWMLLDNDIHLNAMGLAVAAGD